MEPLPPAGARRTRLALVAFGLFLLLAIVGLATRAGFGARSNAAPSQGYLNYAMSIFFVLFVLAIPVAMYLYYLQQREQLGAGAFKRRPFLQTITIVFVFGVLAFLVHEIYKLRDRGIFKGLVNPPPNPQAKARHHGAVARRLEPTFQWPVLVATVLILVAALVAYLVMRRRKGRREHVAIEAPEVNLELADAISDAIEDLEAEPDARRAVIAAYARMEGVLARRGLPRRPSETPFEYLARVLLELRARAESVRRLTTLFERAKFSRHDIDLRMKFEAIAALEAIRDELRAAAA